MQDGYTHANWVYTDRIIKNITSFDFTSSYPYILVTHRFPASEFIKCNITKKEQMLKNFAYLLTIEFTNIKCKYYNNFISASKCIEIVNGVYDNGRIISSDKIKVNVC